MVSELTHIARVHKRIGFPYMPSSDPRTVCTTVKELRQNQFILIILYTCSEIALKVKQNGAYHNYKNIVQF